MPAEPTAPVATEIEPLPAGHPAYRVVGEELARLAEREQPAERDGFEPVGDIAERLVADKVRDTLREPAVDETGRRWFHREVETEDHSCQEVDHVDRD